MLHFQMQDAELKKKKITPAKVITKLHNQDFCEDRLVGHEMCHVTPRNRLNHKQAVVVSSLNNFLFFFKSQKNYFKVKKSKLK